MTSVPSGRGFDRERQIRRNYEYAGWKWVETVKQRGKKEEGRGDKARRQGEKEREGGAVASES